VDKRRAFHSSHHSSWRNDPIKTRSDYLSGYIKKISDDIPRNLLEEWAESDSTSEDRHRRSRHRSPYNRGYDDMRRKREREFREFQKYRIDESSLRSSRRNNNQFPHQKRYYMNQRY